MEDDCIDEIAIGDYLISKDEGILWISRINDGEGGEFDESALAEVVEKFYMDNF